MVNCGKRAASGLSKVEEETTGNGRWSGKQ